MSNENTSSFWLKEDEKIQLTLCGRTFLVSTHFSLNDLELYQELLAQEDDGKKALIHVIYSKFEQCDPPIPTPEELYTEHDDAFQPYISAVVSKDQRLQEIYEQTDETLSISERFRIANNRYWKECTKGFAKALQPTIQMMEQVCSGVDFAMLANVQHVFAQCQPVINGALLQAAQMAQFQPVMNGALLQAAQMAQQAAQIVAPIQNALVQFSSVFSNIIQQIQTPTFTDEQKQKLEENYRAWGKLGWSAIPRAPMNLFYKAPVNAKEADEIALHYFNQKGINELFSMIQERPVKKEDLTAAIFCFKNRQYKACALLLFGIMDAKLIRFQPQKQTQNRRQVGHRAVKVLQAKFEEKADTEFFLFHMLWFAGLIECLGVFFADGKDFREEPPTINRNFVDHGMNRRAVRRKDCIQLFLAVYNLMHLLEDI